MTDSMVFGQQNTNLLSNPIPTEVVNLVSYAATPKQVGLTKCDYVSEVLYDNSGVFGCKSCEMETDFLANRPFCQNGGIARFFNWSIEEFSDSQEITADGKILCYFKILGYNLPVGTEFMLSQISTFLES